VNGRLLKRLGETNATMGIDVIKTVLKCPNKYIYEKSRVQEPSARRTSHS
jgi:hypothetical protein